MTSSSKRDSPLILKPWCPHWIDCFSTFYNLFSQRPCIEEVGLILLIHQTWCSLRHSQPVSFYFYRGVVVYQWWDGNWIRAYVILSSNWILRFLLRFLIWKYIVSDLLPDRDYHDIGLVHFDFTLNYRFAQVAGHSNVSVYAQQLNSIENVVS